MYYLFSLLSKGLRQIKKFPVITFQMFIFIPFSILGLFLFCYGIYLFMADGSFLTKINIFSHLGSYFQHISLFNIFFGCGSNIDNMIYYFGLATHALIPTYIVWYGIIEICLISLFWLQMLCNTKYQGIWIIIAIFIVGFSLSPACIHILYVALAIITYFEKILPLQERRKNAISINYSTNI